MLRIPHCLDNRLTDGGKAVALSTHEPEAPAIKLIMRLRIAQASLFLMLSPKPKQNVCVCVCVCVCACARARVWKPEITRLAKLRQAKGLCSATLFSHIIEHSYPSV
jgi:hypothetical protein